MGNIFSKFISMLRQQRRDPRSEVRDLTFTAYVSVYSADMKLLGQVIEGDTVGLASLLYLHDGQPSGSALLVWHNESGQVLRISYQMDDDGFSSDEHTRPSYTAPEDTTYAQDAA